MKNTKIVGAVFLLLLSAGASYAEGTRGGDNQNSTEVCDELTGLTCTLSNQATSTKPFQGLQSQNQPAITAQSVYRSAAHPAQPRYVIDGQATDVIAWLDGLDNQTYFVPLKTYKEFDAYVHRQDLGQMNIVWGCPPATFNICGADFPFPLARNGPPEGPVTVRTGFSRQATYVCDAPRFPRGAWTVVPNSEIGFCQEPICPSVNVALCGTTLNLPDGHDNDTTTLSAGWSPATQTYRCNATNDGYSPLNTWVPRGPQTGYCTQPSCPPTTVSICGGNFNIGASTVNGAIVKATGGFNAQQVYRCNISGASGTWTPVGGMAGQCENPTCPSMAVSPCGDGAQLLSEGLVGSSQSLRDGYSWSGTWQCVTSGNSSSWQLSSSSGACLNPVPMCDASNIGWLAPISTAGFQALMGSPWLGCGTSGQPLVGALAYNISGTNYYFCQVFCPSVGTDAPTADADGGG